MDRNEKGEKVVNEFICPECKLSAEEKFGKVFHPKIKKAYEDGILLMNGKPFCHRFHTVGY